MFEAKTHAQVTKQTAEREVADLTRQRDAVTGQLSQLREMLSGLAGVGTMPGTEPEDGREADEKAEESRSVKRSSTASRPARLRSAAEAAPTAGLRRQRTGACGSGR